MKIVIEPDEALKKDRAMVDLLRSAVEATVTAVKAADSDYTIDDIGDVAKVAATIVEIGAKLDARARAAMRVRPWEAPIGEPMPEGPKR